MSSTRSSCQTADIIIDIIKFLGRRRRGGESIPELLRKSHMEHWNSDLQHLVTATSSHLSTTHDDIRHTSSTNASRRGRKWKKQWHSVGVHCKFVHYFFFLLIPTSFQVQMTKHGGTASIFRLDTSKRYCRRHLT